MKPTRPDIPNFLLKALAPILFCALLGTATRASGDWKGRVVERTSGWPVEGAVVLIVWERCALFSLHGCHSQFRAAAEAVSDRDGRFVISPPLSIRFFPGRAEYRRLYVFKAEYGLWNSEKFPNTNVRSEEPDKFWRQAENEGAVIELPPLQTVSQRRSFFWTNSGRKPWRDIPQDRAPLWHRANDAEAKFLEEYEKNFPPIRDDSYKMMESHSIGPVKCLPGQPDPSGICEAIEKKEYLK